MIEKLKKILADWNGALTTIVFVSLLVGGFRGVGSLQRWELLAFDWFTNLRPTEPPDERIIIVAITDKDIAKLNTYPVPDRVLADLIRKISAQNPRVIGLDIFRDLPVPEGDPEGEKELQSVFLETKNLVGISKVTGNELTPSIPGNKILEQERRIGAADVLPDVDGKLRRASLYPSTKLGVRGLWLMLAWGYLKIEGISRTTSQRSCFISTVSGKRECYLEFGNVIFYPFKKNDGGYVNAVNMGYEVLINWRFRPETVARVEMTQVLSDRIPQDLFRDKIVLIGVMSKTVKDQFFTPYTLLDRNQAIPTYGVEVQANFVSHIISAVLDNRPTIKVWPDAWEYFWITVWIGVPAIVGWYGGQKSNKPLLMGVRVLFPAVGLTFGVSYFCYWAFANYGYWLPIVPLWVGMPLSTVVVLGWIFIAQIRKDQRELRQFLEAVPVGVFVADVNGQPYYANQTAQEILGKGIPNPTTHHQLTKIYQAYLAGSESSYPSEQLPIIRALKGEKAIVDNMEIRRQVYSSDQEVVVFAIVLLIREKLYRFISPLLHHRSIPLEISATPIYDEKGKISYAIAAFQDISERQKAEAERIKFTKELESKNAQLESARLQLQEANRNLEQKVEERTKQLKATRDKLVFENRILKKFNDSKYYQIGGAVENAAYVVRSADRYLYAALKNDNEFCHIFNARQMGKSSLIVQTVEILKKEGFTCCVIDVSKSRKNESENSEEKWYVDFFYQLIDGFNLEEQLKEYLAWWKNLSITPLLKIHLFIKTVILKKFSNRIAIFIDEIDSTLSLNFDTDNFFGLIRSFYEQRRVFKEYNRLTFIISGVADASQLVSALHYAPFNIGTGIKLEPFELHDCEILAKGLTQIHPNPIILLERILYWTGGQPFLTQKICKIIRDSKTPIKLGLETESIDSIVTLHILDDWDLKDEPQHFKTIKHRLLSQQSSSVQLLRLYQKLLREREIPLSHSPLENELLLTGLVCQKLKTLKIYNLIYQKIFNKEWVEKQLIKLQKEGRS